MCVSYPTFDDPHPEGCSAGFQRSAVFVDTEELPGAVDSLLKFSVAAVESQSKGATSTAGYIEARRNLGMLPKYWL